MKRHKLWKCTSDATKLVLYCISLLFNIFFWYTHSKKWLIQGCFKRGVLFCLVSFFKRGIHAVLFLVFKMVSTIKIRYFHHILSRFSDEMRVSGGGDSTPSFLDPSMLIYFSQWMIHVYFFLLYIRYSIADKRYLHNVSILIFVHFLCNWRKLTSKRDVSGCSVVSYIYSWYRMIYMVCILICFANTPL